MQCNVCEIIYESKTYLTMIACLHFTSRQALENFKKYNCLVFVSTLRTHFSTLVHTEVTFSLLARILGEFIHSPPALFFKSGD